MSPSGRRRSDHVLLGFLVAAISAVVLATRSPVAAQKTAPPATAVVQITGKVEHSFTFADLKALPQKKLVVTDERGAKVTYEGVAVSDLLRRAGVPLGKQLRGPLMALYLVVGGADGYRAVFALPEFDPDFTDRVIILADERDGHPLLPPEGPFRVIVPGEKRHARWVKQVITLDVEEAR
jgi:DMSO/TMAO reductase YedYZ molybdopterin-dependent catalytic subunit